MADSIYVEMRGVEEIQKKLNLLAAMEDGSVVKRIFRRNIRKALRPVERMAIALAPSKTGLLKKSIKIRPGKKSNVSTGMIVSP